VPSICFTRPLTTWMTSDSITLITRHQNTRFWTPDKHEVGPEGSCIYLCTIRCGTMKISLRIYVGHHR
jgi:hypothetical protein